MRYLVVGTGALGTVFGGLLRHAGHPVSFLGRGAHFEQLCRQGGLITGIWGEFPLEPVSRPQPGELYDIILLCVKSFDTEIAAGQALPFAAPESLVISLQNGLGNVELIARTFGTRRTIGGRVIFGAQVTRPGQVTVTVYADRVLLGALDPEAPQARLSQVVADFNRAGLPTRAVPHILTHIWGKVLYNCALNPLGAILGVPYGALGEHPETRELMRLIIEEIYRVAEAKGVPLPLPTASLYFRHFLEDLVPPTASHRPSMWQDLEAGRRTEIDALNGAIWRYAEEMGLKTPYNQAVTRLVRFLEGLKSGTGEGRK